MDETIGKKLESFFSRYREQTIKKGEILIRAGDDPSGIFYIQEGIVRQYYISKNGDEITLNMFKPRAFFPMSWAVGNIHNNYYFEAMTDCFVYKTPKDDVLKFIKDEPDILLDLLRRVYIGMEGIWMHIEYLSTGNAHAKLVSTLLTLGKRFGKKENGKTIIQLKMTEKELGEYAGMYRETVSREFQTLKKNGLVSYEKGEITIEDITKLENELNL